MGEKTKRTRIYVYKSHVIVSCQDARVDELPWFTLPTTHDNFELARRGGDGEEGDGKKGKKEVRRDRAQFVNSFQVVRDFEQKTNQMVSQGRRHRTQSSFCKLQVVQSNHDLSNMP